MVVPTMAREFFEFDHPALPNTYAQTGASGVAHAHPAVQLHASTQRLLRLIAGLAHPPPSFRAPTDVVTVSARM